MAPRFIQKPRSTEVVEGDSLVIVCQVIGDPKPEVIFNLFSHLHSSQSKSIDLKKKKKFSSPFFSQQILKIHIEEEEEEKKDLN